MRRIDFRLDDEWWELAECLAHEIECSVHQLAYQSLINEITLLSHGDTTTARALQAVLERQRQRDRQRQRESI